MSMGVGALDVLVVGFIKTRDHMVGKGKEVCFAFLLGVYEGAEGFFDETRASLSTPPSKTDVRSPMMTPNSPFLMGLTVFESNMGLFAEMALYHD